MKRQNVRTLSLIVVTFTYLLLGAAVFDALESEFEGQEDRRLRELADQLRRKYNMTQDDFDEITQLGIHMKPYKAGTQWKFAGAFYFATTVITTIGYGHSTPKTMEGKIFCMCYAVPGIPLCLIMFQSIGERMNTIITWILRQVKKLLSCKNRSVSQTNLMIVSSTTGATVLTIGAAVFSRYEDWGYLDSFYYCFITLTTIGFGDFVALQRNDSLAKRPDYVAFSLIFILFGLTVVSSVMNLLVLRFLTMNTEDERRDQLEAAVHAQELRRLRGDVIWVDQTNTGGETAITSYKLSQPTLPATVPTSSGIDIGSWAGDRYGGQTKHRSEYGMWARLQSWLAPTRHQPYGTASSGPKATLGKTSPPELSTNDQQTHNMPPLLNLFPNLTRRSYSTDVERITYPDHSTQFTDWHPYPGTTSHAVCSNPDARLIGSNPFASCDPLAPTGASQLRTSITNQLFSHPDYARHRSVYNSHLDPGRPRSPPRAIGSSARRIGTYASPTTAWFDTIGCWYEDMPLHDSEDGVVVDNNTIEGDEDDDIDCVTDQTPLDPLICPHRYHSIGDQSEQIATQLHPSSKDDLTDEDEASLDQFNADGLLHQQMDRTEHVTNVAEMPDDCSEQSSDKVERFNRSSI